MQSGKDNPERVMNSDINMGVRKWVGQIIRFIIIACDEPYFSNDFLPLGAGTQRHQRLQPKRMLRKATLRLQLPKRRHLQYLHGYRINHSGNSPTQMDSFLKAYGDFNNDLRADYVSVDSNGNTLIFLYSTSSGNYEQTANSLPPY